MPEEPLASIALIDSHVHTDDDRLNDDLAAVLRSAREAGVLAQIVPAISRRLWARVRDVCAGNIDLHPCYGLHPCFYHEHADDDIRMLAHWLGHEKAVAVGECGLDYFIAGANKAQQQRLFDAQLVMAREFDLPIVIHARRAVEDVIRMIRASGHYRGQIHSFNGSIQQAHRLIDLGYCLSFGGAVTYDRAKRLRDVVAKVPLHSLLLETDAPDQTDAEHHGQRNEPAFLPAVWQVISELRSEDAEEVARQTTANAVRLFRLREGIPADILNAVDRHQAA